MSGEPVTDAERNVTDSGAADLDATEASPGNAERHGPAGARLMQGLAVLPLFFPLSGKRVVLAGATERAVWKAELLQATGAVVDIYAADPCPAMKDLVADSTALRLHARGWAATDLAGAALALLDSEDDAEAERFRAAARAAGAPMNAIDNPPFCDFQFGAIIDRSPLVIGVSTHGTAPVLGQAVRARLEALLPSQLRAWAEAARAWRARLLPLALPFRARRRFWEMFSDRALGALDGGPCDADYDRFLSHATGQIGRAHV